MRALGYFLITAGFLIGAYFAVQQPENLPLGGYLAGLAVGILGVVIVQTARRRASRGADRLATNMATLESSLARVADNARALDAEKESIDVYDLKTRIDATFPADLGAFVDARESIIHRHSLQAYADVMNPFAAGERYLNRVWSCSTDGYIDEAHEYLGRAHEQFEEALAVLRTLPRPAGPAESAELAGKAGQAAEGRP